MASTVTIPPWERYTLSVEEAAAYFRIGENKLCKIISKNENADFILWNGNRLQIKWKEFEQFADKLNCYLTNYPLQRESTYDMITNHIQSVCGQMRTHMLLHFAFVIDKEVG